MVVILTLDYVPTLLPNVPTMETFVSILAVTPLKDACTLHSTSLWTVTTTMFAPLTLAIPLLDVFTPLSLVPPITPVSLPLVIQLLDVSMLLSTVSPFPELPNSLETVTKPSVTLPVVVYWSKYQEQLLIPVEYVMETMDARTWFNFLAMYHLLLLEDLWLL